jgi:hypothetical protein
MGRSSLRSVQLCLWANLLVAFSQAAGVPKTIWLIRCLARLLPLRRGSLDEHSQSLDRILKPFPFLFLRRRQRCLIRGLSLFFTAKRLGLDVCLQFGSKLEDGEFLTHCWILCDGKICFEPEKIPTDFVLLVEYS